jgi:hypothetical protein
MMGPEAMKNAAYTCTECVTTPSIIVEDLKVCPFRIFFYKSNNVKDKQADAW